LPLRGKVLNTEKASLDEAYKNEEINTMIHAIGAGVGSDFDIEDSNYDKVIIMTDADVDGSHIRILLLTFFYRYMRPVLEQGHVYAAQPPLYKVSRGGKNEKYFYDDESLEEYMQSIDRKGELQRYKGLGEMNPDQLWETTMDPERRILIKVKLDDAMKADEMLNILHMQINGMGSCWETECAIKDLIEELKEEVAKGETLERLKDKYDEAKDRAVQAIPEVKKTCSKAITTAGNIGKGFADTINKEIPQISEGIGRVKAAAKNTKKGIKSKIKEWALSDDKE